MTTQRLLPILLQSLLIFSAPALRVGAAEPTVSVSYLDAKAPVEDRIRDLLSKMTLEEKVAQMDQYTLYDALNAKNRGTVETLGIGSILSEFDAKQYAELAALTAKSRLKIPVLLGQDACHGNGFYEGATIFPTNISIAATFDKDLAKLTARQAAKETRAWGHQWVFTPTLDVTRDTRFGRSGETFGECPYVTSVMAEAYVSGYQNDLNPADTVAACPKHFVAGGASEGGVNHATAELSERTLRTDFLAPFKAAVDAGCLSIMAGHNDVNGVPMHANKWLLTDVLKGEYGFTGLVVSDMADVGNLVKGKLHNTAATHEAALAQGINAGVDIYMNSHSPEEFITPMVKLVKEGRVPMSRIDDAVSRILRVKFKLGLFDTRFVKSPETTPRSLASDESRRIALQGAREAMTLLKNDGGLLPIARGKYKRILVTGPNADSYAILGDWAVKQPKEYFTTVVDAIRDAAGPDTEVVFVKSGRIRGKASKITKQSVETADIRILNQKIAEEGGALDDTTIDAAAREAKNADLTVVIGGGTAIRGEWSLRTYGESCDAPSIGLPGRQLDLVKALHATGKPVVVVLASGKVCNEPWVNENIPAILYAWEPGLFGGRAIAETLFGDNNPSGRLPFTFAKTAAHLPMYYYQRHSRFWTGYGYSGGKADDKPSYEFGHGLSYTTFQYSDITVPKELPLGADIPASVTVTNTGKVAGDHSVLLFVSDVVASVSPAIKELKGFSRVSLKPGETKTVNFTVKPAQLALWNPELKHVVEPGEFILRIGDKKATVTLTGDKDLPVGSPNVAHEGMSFTPSAK